MESYFEKEQRDMLFTRAFCERLYPPPPFFQHSLSPGAFIKKIKKEKKPQTKQCTKVGGVKKV